MSNLLTKEQHDFLQQNVVGKTTQESTILINRQFNLNLTNTQIRNYKKKHNLRSGVVTRFKKGNIPFNKKPIGSEFICLDGYTYIKIAEPNIWVHKNIYIFEQKYGKIPKGYSVMFADKDKTNFNLKNLILVKNKDKLTAKNRHLIFINKELTETGILIARLINESSKRKKEEQSEIRK